MVLAGISLAVEVYETELKGICYDGNLMSLEGFFFFFKKCSQ